MTGCILHVVASREPEAGSVAIPLAGLCRALRRRDVASAVVATDQCWASFDSDTAEPTDPRRCAELVASSTAVHIHGWGRGLSVELAAIARRLRRPFVISPAGGLTPGPHTPVGLRARLRARFTERKLVRSAAALLTLNDAEYDDLHERRVHPTLTQLPYGLEMADYEGAPPTNGANPSMATPPDGRNLLLLAPIHPVEGHVVLLKALAELGRSCGDWGVILAGKSLGEWQDMLEAAVRRKGGTDRVVFTEAADVASQRSLLARASVLVSPGLRVGCPVSVLQAAASGVSVLASDRMLPRELAGTVHTSAPSQAGLRESLRAVLSMTDDDRAARANEARERARKTLDWSVLVDRYVELYQRIS